MEPRGIDIDVQLPLLSSFILMGLDLEESSQECYSIVLCCVVNIETIHLRNRVWFPFEICESWSVATSLDTLIN